MAVEKITVNVLYMIFLQHEDTVAIRALNDLVAKDDRVYATLQNIGEGLTICIKK